MADSVEAFESEVLEALRPLIERVQKQAYESGYRDALSSLLQTAQDKLQNPPHGSKPVGFDRSPNKWWLNNSVQDTKPSNPPKRMRARHGYVRGLVKQIVNETPTGIRQVGIVQIARSTHNFELKPSSMRMALDILERSGDVEQRDGHWFPRGNGAPDAPPVNPKPSVQAVDAAGKAGGT